MPNYFASGGMVSRGSASVPNIDTEVMADRIAEAYSRLPNPVVDVRDIILQGERTVNVNQRASF